ncbi:MAG: DNA-processing protein DprA [Armatimonadota bacterium]
MRVLSTVLAALYGEGENRPGSRSSRHTQILSCLRRGLDGETEPSWNWILSTLRREGFVTEAVHLMNTRRITQAEVLLDRQEIVTSACAAYPQSLLKHLGRCAPPVLWVSDPSMAATPPWQDEDGLDRFGVGGVGSRQPPPMGVELARATGHWCSDRGYFGVSGAAEGCDAAFGDGILGAQGDVVHFLPCGMDHGRWLGYALSVCPPREPFSTGRAMERNGLIYAMAHFTVVCSARFRKGGSWQGAAAAIKGHQAVAVADWTSTGHDASLSENNHGTFRVAQHALANLGAYQLAVDLATHRENYPFALDDAMTWAYDFRAGAINAGLFAAAS